MLLAIDIGNTNITLGIWHGRSWRHQWRLQTLRDKTSDEYGILLKGLLREHGITQIDAVIFASVVPPLTAVFAEVSQRYLNCAAIEVQLGLDVGIRVATDQPTATGTDRIVNAAAAYHLFPGPSIVIDMGTATKFEVVTANGDLIGGAIAPGLGLAADALFSKAAKLSSVTLTPPPQAIGRDTTTAMQSGLIFGYVALIEGMVQRLRQEHPDRDQPITLIATGGLIGSIAAHTTIFDHVDPWLTLTGLQIIYHRLAEQRA